MKYNYYKHRRKYHILIVILAVFYVVSAILYIKANNGVFEASKLLGQLDDPLLYSQGSGTEDYTQSGINSEAPTVNAVGMNNPNSISIDSSHHLLFVADTGNNRVLIFRLDQNNDIQSYVNGQDQAADYVLGQNNFTDGANFSGFH